MNKQQASPKWAVLGAGVFLVLAAAAFGVAFYYYDGASIVADALDEISLGGLWPSRNVPRSAETSPAAGAPTADELVLPAGMPDTFALRLWQEQVDSQPMIRRLVSGDVKRMVISDVKTEDDTSRLIVRVTLKDGSVSPGEIVLRKFRDAWFVSTATADERLETMPMGSLPSLDKVDIALLNTLIAEQLESRTATEEYAKGQVFSIELGSPETGPNTVRIPVIMNEDHERATADLVAIRQEVGGRKLWFLARFGKTGSEPLKD